jgi:hypothetical protein
VLGVGFSGSTPRLGVGFSGSTPGFGGSTDRVKSRWFGGFDDRVNAVLGGLIDRVKSRWFGGFDDRVNAVLRGSTSWSSADGLGLLIIGSTPCWGL